MLIKKYRKYIILGVGFISLVLSFALADIIHDTFFMYVDIAYIAVILCGAPLFYYAAKSLSERKITSGLLICVSIIACITLEILTLSGVLNNGDGHGHGYIFAAGEVAFLMYLGEIIEEITVKKARSGISRLISLAPVTAKYKVDGALIERPVSEIKIGDRVIVLAGDIISVDGTIVEGESAVDASIMTGEPLPVDVKKGDLVYGGTMNKSGVLEILVTKNSDEMAVNKIKKLVEEAEGKKAPISRLADKWASYIVPSAIILSIAMFILTYFVFAKNDVSESVLRGITMLVVFCPCALALATPTAVAAGLGAAAKNGVLIKSGGALEALAKAEIVALDKTGTLTEGRICVDDIICYGAEKSHVAQMAGSTELLSEHPIAKAIVNACKSIADLKECSATKSLVGAGVESVVDGKKIIVCSYDYLDKIGVGGSLAEADIKGYFSKGKTVSCVVEEGSLIGLIVLSDKVKDNARESIQGFKDLGLSTVMLTGDNKFSAAEIAKAAGIDSVNASLLPEGKLNKIKELKDGGKRVVMIGDGVNDAPALAAADCSIAMGALGSDAAIETADISLMKDDIMDAYRVTRFSKKVVNTIKFNIIMSMSINVIALILNTLGLLNPVTGALIHNCSSVLVVLNSALLLSKWSKKKKV